MFRDLGRDHMLYKRFEVARVPPEQQGEAGHRWVVDGMPVATDDLLLHIVFNHYHPFVRGQYERLGIQHVEFNSQNNPA